jgi:hypothetical protein
VSRASSCFGLRRALTKIKCAAGHTHKATPNAKGLPCWGIRRRDGVLRIRYADGNHHKLNGQPLHALDRVDDGKRVALSEVSLK